jgi:hypothetical protein
MNVSYLFPPHLPLDQGTSATSYRPSLVDIPSYSLPLRLRAQESVGVGGLYGPSSRGVYDLFIPVFYGKTLSACQRDLTGWIVELDAFLIDIPKEWSRLFNPKPSEAFGDKGLLLSKIRKIRKQQVFMLDIWRLDYFPFTSFEETRVAPYQRRIVSKRWPNAAQILSSYLGFMSFEGYKRKKINTFGILPRVNMADSSELRRSRKNLTDYYTFSYEQVRRNRSQWIEYYTSVGHGVLEPDSLTNTRTVFQYDQIDPIMKQEFR